MLLFLILNIIAQFYFLGVILVFLTVGLNMIFIPIYGILGSAFATLLSITLYSLAKLMFVVKRLHLFPFTKQTLYSMGLTLILFYCFIFWQFPFSYRRHWT
jgi:O-antigen/teichoic acid export membrane protein